MTEVDTRWTDLDQPSPTRRQIVAQPPKVPDTTGWLAAVRDPHVGRALALIHREPGARWTVESLARRAGLSRTVFFERWSALVGEPPAKYLARWRVMSGADQLRRSPVDLSTLAMQLGYASDGSFSRSFERHYGLTPREYRKTLSAQADIDH